LKHGILNTNFPRWSFPPHLPFMRSEGGGDIFVDWVAAVSDA
jgi:hypothetical protein